MANNRTFITVTQFSNNAEQTFLDEVIRKRSSVKYAGKLFK